MKRSVIVDAHKLDAARVALGWSLEDLASHAMTGPFQFSSSSLKRAREGKGIDIATAAALAGVLRVRLLYLLQKAPDPKLLPQPTLTLAAFRTLGSDPRVEHVAEGLAAELKVRLHRVWFPVVSTAGPTEADTVLQSEARNDLGTHYLIGGTVDLEGEEVRVTVEVTDVEREEVRWGKSYSRPLQKLFSLQRELAGSICAELDHALVDAEAIKLEGYEPKDLQAWQQGIRGARHFYRRSAQDNEQARQLLSGALRADRSMPLAWYWLALTHQQDLVNQWTTNQGSSIAGLAQVCESFERYYASEPWSQIVCAYLDIYSGERQRAEDRLAKAIDTDPNISHARALYGQTLAMKLDADCALEQLTIALRLGPRDADRWTIYTSIALTHFATGDYPASIQAAARASSLRPDAAFPYGTIASAHALLGNDAEAKQAVENMRRYAPRSTPAGLRAVVASAPKDVAARYLQGLKQAGLSN